MSGWTVKRRSGAKASLIRHTNPPKVLCTSVKVDGNVSEPVCDTPRAENKSIGWRNPETSPELRASMDL